MIKTILVALDGSEHARAAARYGSWLAKQFDATLRGLHVVDIVTIEGSFLHDISGSLGFEPYLDFSTRMREVLQERGEAILEEFRATASAAGIRFDATQTTGVVANEIADAARTSDLLVIGHRGINEKFSTGLLGSTAEGIVRKSSGPVLVSPLEFRECQSPLLAYDGSPRAAAAMHSAAEFCSLLRLPLTVLTVHREEAAGRLALSEAETYLAAYRIPARFELLPEVHAPEHIAAFLRERRHDLLFIGAHGHSRIIELVIGSTTEYVLRNVNCPLFLHR